MPLGNVGLGQPLVFVFMGLLMVMATYYVQTVTLTGQALLAALPVACLVTAILVVNDLRDIEEDRQTGKITPVSQFWRGVWAGDVYHARRWGISQHPAVGRGQAGCFSHVAGSTGSAAGVFYDVPDQVRLTPVPP